MRIAFAPLVVVLACCATTPGRGGEPPVTAAAAPSKGDALFAQREDPKKLEAAVEAYEKEGNSLQAARACRLRLELHADLRKENGDLRGEAEPWIDRGLRNGERALGAADPADVVKKLPALTKKDATALYWYAGLYGNKIPFASLFSQKGMAGDFQKMAERAAELDGAVYSGGPHRMLSDFFRQGGLFFGDNKRAAEEVAKAVAVEPRFLEAYVLRAQLAKDQGRVEDARKDLEHAIAAPADALPDVVPEQKVAQADARKLLAELKK